jgi:hypothetical protein
MAIVGPDRPFTSPTLVNDPIAAIVSAFWAFVSMTFYPVWGICIIAMDVAIIWALTAHGRDIQKAQDMGMSG